MKLVLHIGTEKTGTTTIQHFLNENRKKLKSKGFHVLNCAGRFNHRAVPSFCMDENRENDYFQDSQYTSVEFRRSFKKKFKKEFDHELNSVKSKAHTVIITSEHFHSRLESHEELQNLKYILAPHFTEIRILCYLREQSSLADSAYSSCMQAGAIIGVKKFLSECIPGNSFFDYSLFLNKWADVFGQKSIQPRVFDRDHLVKRDLIQDFLTFLDSSFDKVDFNGIEDKNKSIGNLGKVIARSFNLVSPKYDKKGRINLENRRIIKQIRDNFDEKGTAISLKQYDLIYNAFSESNKELAKRFFNRSENPFPYKRPIDTSQAINDEDSDVLADLIRSLKRCSYFSESDAHILEDAAVSLENENKGLSYKLMVMAQKLRPHATSIKEKIEQYKEDLNT